VPNKRELAEYAATMQNANLSRLAYYLELTDTFWWQSLTRKTHEDDRLGRNK